MGQIVRSITYTKLNNELPQIKYDPERAKFHLRKAGLDSLTVKLHTADAAYTGAVDTALLMRESAAKAGINIEGMCAIQCQGKGIIHIVVNDSTGARHALEAKGDTRQRPQRPPIPSNARQTTTRPHAPYTTRTVGTGGVTPGRTSCARKTSPGYYHEIRRDQQPPPPSFARIIL